MSDAATLATKIKVALDPANVLLVASGDGCLIASLLAEGIDAHALAGSEEERTQVSDESGDKVTVGSPVDKIDGSWDLVVCIDALEGLSASDADRAIDNIAGASARVLFASSPDQSALSMRTPATWAAAFAERGLIRRTDFDFSSLAPRAMLLERQSVTLRDLVYRYEREIDTLSALAHAQRQRMLATDRLANPAQEIDEIRELRRQLLISKDHAIGSEAELGTLRAENLKLHHEIARLQTALVHQGDLAQEVAAVRESATWKVGRMVIGPVSRLRSTLGR